MFSFNRCLLDVLLCVLPKAGAQDMPRASAELLDAADTLGRRRLRGCGGRRVGFPSRAATILFKLSKTIEKFEKTIQRQLENGNFKVLN